MTNDNAYFTAIFRCICVSAGVIGGLLMGTVTGLIGGTWLALPVCAVLGGAIGKVIPVEYPNGPVGNALYRALRTGRSLNHGTKLLLAVLLVGLVSALDASLRVLTIPATFYLFVVPSLVSAALFGVRVGLATVVLTLLSVTYFAIPPKYSFAVGTIWDLVCLGAFAVVALISFGMMTIQSGFVETDEDNRPFFHT